MRSGGPRQDTKDKTQYGLHYGVVVQNKDPDGLSRIKVRLPWLDQGDTDQTHWAQLLTPMEGAKWGWYVLPDIDDVVVVMFIAGDMSQPVVVGGVWSKVDNSPEPNEDGANNFRGYRSRVGHRMVFDDTKSGTKLWSYQTGAGHRGASVSYAVNGRQFIATATGWHVSVVGGAMMGLFPDQDWRLGSTLVVFALPEQSR